MRFPPSDLNFELKVRDTFNFKITVKCDFTLNKIANSLLFFYIEHSLICRNAAFFFPNFQGGLGPTNTVNMFIRKGIPFRHTIPTIFPIHCTQISAKTQYPRAREETIASTS